MKKLRWLLLVSIFALLFGHWVFEEHSVYITAKKQLQVYTSTATPLNLWDVWGDIRDIRGYIFMDTDEAVAQAISRLMGDKKICAQLGEAGFECVKFISWDYVIENLLGAI